MEKIELTASKREVVKKQAKALRAAGKIPAVVYGHGVSSQPLEVDAKSLEKVYRQTGGNKIIALKVGDR
jgi:large subunit ribosomal protein L25